MSESPKKFYLTTPIYYVNARPHIGHAYTTIVADVIARRHRLLGDHTYFLTGTDEHGQKIERSAAAAGIPPQQFADQVSAEFRSLWDRMGLTYDDYIRTTEPRHQQGAQRLFALLHQRGQIYLSSYTGQYSVGEEIFVDGPPGVLGPDGKPTETVTEENFFFKLSEYQLPLIDLIESDGLLIQPESRKNEVLSFLRGNVTEATAAGTPTALSKLGTPYVPGNLRDLSVSRSSFTWGIPVPEPASSETKQKHVIYVWLDALANYMTAVGYGSDKPEDIAKFKTYWPADLHIMAKEITRQHCIYWPAFLLAADLPLPKAVTAHGWLLFDDSKMSKSKGNIVRTETILNAFGTLKPKPADGPGAVLSDEYWKHQQDLFASDVIRYFLLREIPFGQDGSFSFDALVTRYNADLANGYGNLVSRTLNMLHKYFEANVPSYPTLPNEIVDDEVRFTAVSCQKLKSSLIDAPIDFTYRFDKSAFNGTLEGLFQLVGSLDLFLTEQAPWRSPAGLSEELVDTRRAQILYTAAESIRIITALLHPILPHATAAVWQQLGLGDIEEAAHRGELKDLQWGGLKPGTKLGPLAPIFPRADKSLIQQMTDMEQNMDHKNITAHADAKTSLLTEFPEASLASATPAPSKFVDEKTTHTAVITEDPTQPPPPPPTTPRTAQKPRPPVARPASITTERPATPPHTEAPASGIFATPQIAIDDFIKIDLRVAQIIVAERIPKADKLLRLEVDLGYEKRQILSGIAEWYTPEELLGKKIVVIANLAPRKMRGLESHGMLLAASHGENGKPILATFGEDIALGSRLK